MDAIEQNGRRSSYDASQSNRQKSELSQENEELRQQLQTTHLLQVRV